ncbi:MAG: ABC transporter permease [Fimbriiglobus sp.]
MDAGPTTIRFNRFLPYWAVLQTDFRQTLQSWVYRLWVLMSVLAASGYLLYNVGLQREAGISQAASMQSVNLLRGLVIAGLGLVALLAVSSISSEKSTVADAILSRGISRYQYFLAKWHARTLVIVGTFGLLAAGVLLAYHFIFDGDLSAIGGLVAGLMVAMALMVVVSWGVTIGALANGTVIGITLFWFVLYGVIVLLSLLPEPYPTPDRMLTRLNYVLRGEYNPAIVTQIVIVTVGLSLAAATVGLIGFARKDV